MLTATPVRTACEPCLAKDTATPISNVWKDEPVSRPDLPAAAKGSSGRAAGRPCAATTSTLFPEASAVGVGYGSSSVRGTARRVANLEFVALLTAMR